MSRLIVEIELSAEQIGKFQYEAHCSDKSVDALATEVIAVYSKSGDMAKESEVMTEGKGIPCG